MSNLSFGPAPEPEQPKKKQAGFGRHVGLACACLVLMALFPTEAFLLSLLVGGGVLWILLDVLKQYRKAFGAPAEGFGISAENTYRTGMGAPPLPATGLKHYADEVYLANAQMLADLQRIGALDTMGRERHNAQLSQAISTAEKELAAVNAELVAVRDEVLDVRQVADRHNLGFYDYEHPAETSVKLADELAAVRSRIKEKLREKTAVTTVSGFMFNNSTREGNKFVRDLSALLLRAYNAEAENCVKTVKAGNLATAQARLEKAREQIAKRGTMIGLQVTNAYHRLREEELRLAANHLQALAIQKQIEAEARAEAREAAKAQREWEALKAKQKKEVDHYATVLAQLQASGDVEGVQRVQEQLEEAEAKLADAEDNALNTRAGYVYVISNLGAFGQGVVKIGMTRRLNPMERVRELGDASVPFLFDVHALFFSKDAVGVENMLHQHFAGQRVNLVNLRREYFYASPAQVREALVEHHVELVEYQEEAPAEEFTVSRELRDAGQFAGAR
ncbi:DUF4041 domain-containing protein [Arthrobacter koreensis]|uniref:DUF4041 domain-containing protein n=1 Tax=Arthrobacter koreensis TaxID=199136 RepID=UPI00186B4CF1|nr:DUF4041 domain-containing protein [Arthrobacter koreensis]